MAAWLLGCAALSMLRCAVHAVVCCACCWPGSRSCRCPGQLMHAPTPPLLKLGALSRRCAAGPSMLLRRSRRAAMWRRGATRPTRPPAPTATAPPLRAAPPDGPSAPTCGPARHSRHTCCTLSVPLFSTTTPSSLPWQPHPPRGSDAELPEPPPPPFCPVHLIFDGPSEMPNHKPPDSSSARESQPNPFSSFPPNPQCPLSLPGPTPPPIICLSDRSMFF